MITAEVRPGLVPGLAFKANGTLREQRYGGFDSRALPPAGCRAARSTRSRRDRMRAAARGTSAPPPSWSRRAQPAGSGCAQQGRIARTRARSSRGDVRRTTGRRLKRRSHDPSRARSALQCSQHTPSRAEERAATSQHTPSRAEDRAATSQCTLSRIHAPPALDHRARAGIAPGAGHTVVCAVTCDARLRANADSARQYRTSAIPQVSRPSMKPQVLSRRPETCGAGVARAGGAGARPATTSR